MLIIYFNILYIQNILKLVLLCVRLSVIPVKFILIQKQLKCPGAALSVGHLSACMVCSSNL